MEEKLSGELWRGDFPSKYVEEITAKTGAPKKFPAFVRMILTCLKGTDASSPVYIDLLTYQDLEALKTKRSSGPPQASNNKKRYIIMTEVSGGDKVHYPLPLNYIEEPEPDALRRTIDRMRQQILMQKSNAFSSHSDVTTKGQRFTRLDDFASIEHENDALRKQIAEVERTFSLTNVEFFQISQQKFFTESEYEFYRGEAQREI